MDPFVHQNILWGSLDGTHFGGMAILNSLVGRIVGKKKQAS